MKTETKELKLRLELELDKALTEAAKKAGIPKTKLAMQLLTEGLEPKASVVDVVSDRITGAKAKAILVENTENKRWLQEDYQVIWFDGFIWFVGKTANGSQVQLERWLAYPKTLFDGLEEVRFKCKSAAEVKAALERWNDLKALDHIEDLPESEKYFGRFNLRAFFGRYGQEYEELKEKAVAAIAAYKLSEALAEPTADVEPVDNEIAIEVVDVPCSPTIEAVMIEPEQPSTEQPATTLTKREFKVMYQLDDETFSKLGCKLKTGLTTSDGKTWFKLSNSRVTTVRPSHSQLELALG